LQAVVAVDDGVGGHLVRRVLQLNRDARVKEEAGEKVLYDVTADVQL